MLPTLAKQQWDIKECRICGDEIGVLKESGVVFVACYACGFPVCRPCYEYERVDGDQRCPHCHSTYKREVDDNNEEITGGDEFQSKSTVSSHPPSTRLQSMRHQVSIHVVRFSYSILSVYCSVLIVENHQQPSPGSVLSIGNIGEKDAVADGSVDGEWKERVTKWKARQQRRRTNDDDEHVFNSADENDDDSEIL